MNKIILKYRIASPAFPIGEKRLQADAACTLARVGHDEIAVEFPEPQRAVTPGQSVVLYDGEVCLGGAVIA